MEMRDLLTTRNAVVLVEQQSLSVDCNGERSPNSAGHSKNVGHFLFSKVEYGRGVSLRDNNTLSLEELPPVYARNGSVSLFHEVIAAAILHDLTEKTRILLRELKALKFIHPISAKRSRPSFI